MSSPVLSNDTCVGCRDRLTRGPSAGFNGWSRPSRQGWSPRATPEENLDEDAAAGPVGQAHRQGAAAPRTPWCRPMALRPQAHRPSYRTTLGPISRRQGLRRSPARRRGSTLGQSGTLSRESRIELRIRTEQQPSVSRQPTYSRPNDRSLNRATDRAAVCRCSRRLRAGPCCRFSLLMLSRCRPRSRRRPGWVVSI